MVRVRGIWGASAVLLVSLFLHACTDSPPFKVHEGRTMGTYYRLSARCAPLPVPEVDALLKALNATLSTYDPQSELMRLNRAQADTWLPVSDALFIVLETAVNIAQASEGALDVTVGELVNLWGFGPTQGDAAPDAATLTQARAATGFSNLQLDATGLNVRKGNSRFALDLSAIAKGYAVDQVFALMQSRGCLDVMVDIGGEVRLEGHGPSGYGWRIGIEAPDPRAVGAVEHVLQISSGGLATSGDYRNFREVDGRVISHTLDPRTGAPITHGLASVTVIAENTMLADGWATALNVLGPEEGWRLALERDMAVLFIQRANGSVAENGMMQGAAPQFLTRYTPAFKPYLVE